MYAFLWASSEYVIAFIDYGSAFADSKKLLYNFIYHLGNLYDKVDDVITLFTESSDNGLTLT
jgi:hypothetical protein